MLVVWSVGGVWSGVCVWVCGRFCYGAFSGCTIGLPFAGCDPVNAGMT